MYKSIMFAVFAFVCCFGVVSSSLTLLGTYNLTRSPESVVGKAMYWDSTKFYVAFQDANSSIYLVAFSIFNWQVISEGRIYTVGDSVNNVVLNATYQLIVSSNYAFFILEGSEVNNTTQVYSYVLPVYLTDFTNILDPIKLENCPPISDTGLPPPSIVANYKYNYLAWTCGNATSLNFMELNNLPFWQSNSGQLGVGSIVSFDTNNDNNKPQVYFGAMLKSDSTINFYSIDLEHLTVLPLNISVGKNFDCSTFSLLSYVPCNDAPYLVLAVSCANETANPELKYTEVGTIDLEFLVYQPDIFFPQPISNQMFISMSASSSYAWLTTYYTTEDGTYVWKVDPRAGDGDVYGSNSATFVYSNCFTGLKDFAVIEATFYDDQLIQLLEFA